MNFDNLYDTLKATINKKAFSGAAALSLSLVLVQASPAQSMEAMAFFKKLQEQAEKNGNSLTYGSLEDLGGGDIHAENIVVINRSQNSELTIRQFDVTGGQTDGIERFSFDTLTAENIKLETTRPDRKTSLMIKSLNANDFKIDGKGDGSLFYWPFDISLGKARTIRLIQTGDQNVSWNSPEFSIKGLKKTGPKGFSLEDYRIAPSSGSIATSSGANSTFALNEIRIQDLDVSNGLGFRVKSAEFGRFALEGNDEKARTFSFSFDGFLAKNLINPDFTRKTSPFFNDEESRVSMGSAELTMDGAQILTFKGGQAISRFDSKNRNYTTDFSLEDIFLDMRKIGEINNQSKQLKPFFELGYQNINLDFDGAMDWNIDTGMLNLKSIRYSADDMASVDVSMKLAGYTAEFAANIQKISNQLNRSPDKALNDALTLQLLAELSGIEVEEMVVTLHDASLTRRIMEQQAQKSGQKAEDMVAAVPFMAGAMLAPIEAPDFAAMLSNAIGIYMKSALDDAASIRITAKPDEPISFAELTGIIAGMKAGNVKPAEIIDRLNLDVRAN